MSSETKPLGPWRRALMSPDARTRVRPLAGGEWGVVAGTKIFHGDPAFAGFFIDCNRSAAHWMPGVASSSGYRSDRMPPRSCSLGVIVARCRGGPTLPGSCSGWTRCLLTWGGESPVSKQGAYLAEGIGVYGDGADANSAPGERPVHRPMTRLSVDFPPPMQVEPSAPPLALEPHPIR